MASYVKVPWINKDAEHPPTAKQVKELGVLYYTGTGGNSGYATYYVLANHPTKFAWFRAGYNTNPCFVSENAETLVWIANSGSDDTANGSLLCTTKEPVEERVWIMAGIDGYWSTRKAELPYSLVGSYPNDWTAPNSEVDNNISENNTTWVYTFCHTCNDGDWSWAAVDGYSGHSGEIPGPDEPEPTTDPVSPSGTIVVRVTASAGNPYEPGGDSGIGQGNGTFANPDDTIDGPSLPQIGIADGTLIAMFNPTQSELNELGDYLFDDSIWTQAMRSLYGQPMDYILSLGIVPVHPKITPNKVEFSLGPAPVANLSMWQITRQYDEVDCGEITIPEYWGGFLDYEPYTSIQIYLPYIGYRELNPSECLNKPIHVYYHIDLFTGSCIAFIEVGGNILYQFEGNCLVQLPITSVQHAQMMSGIISALGFGATLVATKGLGAFGGMAGDFMTWGAGASAISSIANAAKPSVMHGGNTSASYGIMGIQTPYCIIRRPRQAVATDQNAYSGFASWYRASDFMFTTGFTKVAEIHLDGLAATDWEIQEIERLLKNGVIF